MRTAAEFPRELTLEVDGQEDQLIRAGASYHGYVYRSHLRECCYRLIPEGLTLRQKQALKPLQSARPIPGVARLANAWQPEMSPECFVLQYTVPGLKQTLAEYLPTSQPREGLRQLVQVLNSLPLWWDQVALPMWPLPADFALADKDEIWLLPVPNWGAPNIEQLLSEPIRARHVAPEFLRSQVRWNDRVHCKNLDLFCFGISLLEIFCEGVPTADAELLLNDAATGMQIPCKRRADLPAWMDRLRATEDVIQMGRCLASADAGTRTRLHVPEVANYLLGCQRRMEPIAAVLEVKRTNAGQAYALLRDLLLEDDSYELLLLAGSLASEVNRPLEALDYLERAIKTDGSRSEAYEQQLALMLNVDVPEDPLHLPYVQYIDLATQIDHKLGRNYGFLEKYFPNLEYLRWYRIDLAQHYLWRGEFLRPFYTTAAAFIHPRIFDSQGKHLLWELELNFAYCEALWGQGRLDDARKQFELAEYGLNRFGRNLDISPREVRLAQFHCERMRAKLASAGSNEPRAQS